MNYRINEDRWRVQEYRDRVNYLLGSPVFSSESVIEPLTLQEVKDHLVITASDYDTYITALIKQCRQQFEQVTSTGLISRTVTVTFNNGRGNIELPYGPITSFTSMADKNGTAITGFTLYGSPFQYVESPISNYLSAVYVAGYTNLTIPQGLKLDLLRYIAFSYENRGDIAADFDKALHMYANKHRRGSWLL